LDFVQIIKSEHARVNDMMDKLGDTSDTALKTRERLASQVSTAFDEHTRKEETHLYPMLQKHREAHKEAGEFLDGAREAHREINRLAGELSSMEKNDEGFLAKVSDLKKFSGQHMREEERILPALRRAMSEEEINGLDEALAITGEEMPERAAEGAAAAFRQGADVAAAGARRLTQDLAKQAERGNRAMLVAAEIYSETAQLTAEDLQAIATCSTIAAGGMTDMRQAWMEWLSRSLRAGARASQELLRCTTLEQFAGVQRDFLKESLENLMEGSAQILRISGRISEDARRPIEDRVGQISHSGESRRGSARGSA
jgi:hemerythrin superfamily protein